MLTLFRKSDYFNERVNKKFQERIEKLPAEQKTEILKLKEIEAQRENLMREFEEELKNLELKYDKILGNVTEQKREKIQSQELFSDYWLRVLSNHKIIKEFISEHDKELLKHLTHLKSEKLDDGNSFRLIFTFSENEYFTNTTLEKTYLISSDLLIEKIESSKINWKEGKSLVTKKVSKVLKNKKTGEKKTVEKDEDKLSFFNFFTNLRMPTIEEMKSLDYEVEKELGAHLDNEYEIGIEFVDEIIPYSTEYFVGVTHDSEEFGEYMHERTVEQQEPGNNRKKHHH